MRKTYISLGMVVGMLMSVQAQAETLVEVRNAHGQTQQVFISDDYARMQVSHPQQPITSYRLIDLKMQKMYMVNPNEKRYIDPSIMAMSNRQRHRGIPNMPQQPMFGQRNMPSAPPVDAKLVKVESENVKIAGYPTEHYQVVVNGEVCSDNYFSKSAATIAHIARIDKTMQAIKNTQQHPKPPMQQQHPCMQAQQILEPQIQALGMNMKSIYAMGKMAGKVRSEVVTIKTDEKVNKDFFSLEGFAPLTQQEMQQMMRPRQR